MNILIADSGSTKTEWILVDENKNRTLYSTKGLNPYFTSKEQIAEEVADLMERVEDVAIDKVYFYGAGCSGPVMSTLVRQAISKEIPGAEVIVSTDLLAAAKACFSNRSGIACILGTGSNSCIYDGQKIIDRIPSLGFTLGDEGSAGYFGKKLVRDYYYGIMPEEIRTVLEEKFEMNLENTLERVYRRPRGNAYIASFAYLLGEFPDNDYILDVVEKGFNEFVLKQLFYFKKYDTKNIGFVGSVAAFNSKILEKVLNENGYELDVIVQKPIDRLVDAHLAEETII